MQIINRMIMKHIPNLFSQSKEEQRETINNLTDATLLNIKADLIVALFDIPPPQTQGEANSIMKRLSKPQKYQVDEQLQYLYGVDNDQLTIGKFEGYDEFFYNSTTLYDYDYQVFHYQQVSLNEYNKDMTLRNVDPYMGNLSSTWCRLIEDEHMTYGFLTMLSWHVYSPIEDAIVERMEEYYGAVVDADEKKKVIEIQTKIITEYLTPKVKELKKRYENPEQTRTFIERYKDEYDLPCIRVIFGNTDVLKATRMEHFIADITSYGDNDHMDDIQQYIDAEVKAALEYIEVLYQNVKQ